MPKVYSDGHDIDLHVYYIDLCLGSIDEDSCGEMGKRCVCVRVSEWSSLPNSANDQCLRSSLPS